MTNQETMASQQADQSIPTPIDSLNDPVEIPGGACQLEADRRLTAAAFECVIGKLPTYAQELRDFLNSDLISDPAHLTASKDRLKSDILPCLKPQVTSLSLLLNLSDSEEDPAPSDSEEDPAQKLRMISKLLLELEQTMHKIHALFYVQISDTTKETQHHASLRTNVKPDLTPTRYTRLTWIVTSIVSDIHRLLLTSRSLIVDFNFPNISVQGPTPEVVSRLSDSLSRKKLEISQYTTFCCNLIDDLNVRIDQSDCCLVQQELQREVALLDDALNELFNAINFKPKPQPLDESGTDSDSDSVYSLPNYEYQQEALNEHMLQLAKSILPLIKLSRLFLNKMSKTKATKEPVVLLSKMSSSGLASLLALLARPGSVCREIDEMVSIFDPISGAMDLDHEQFVQHSVIGPAKRLQECFESSILVLMPYLDTLSSAEFDEKIDPKKWFKTWSRQLTLAVQKFINAGMKRA